MDHALQAVPSSSPTVNESLSTDFSEWFYSLIDEVRPAIIVAVARSAVRCVQLQCASILANDVIFVSHYGLPFIGDEVLRGSRVLLIDDSIIFGSTMASIREYLQSRGAIVFCAAYVADRKNFFGEEEGNNVMHRESPFMTLPVRICHRLWPDGIKRHHAAMSRSVLQSPLHYNFDYPTYSLTLESFSCDDVPRIVHLLTKVPGIRMVIDVSTAPSLEYALPRYSVFLQNQFTSYFTGEAIKIEAYPKLRVSFVPSLNQIRITPIFQMHIKDTIYFDDVSFMHPELTRWWHKLSPPCNKSDSMYHQALFRLLNAFLGIILGKSIVNEILTTIGNTFPVRQPELLTDDMILLLGKHNTRVLYRFWEQQDIHFPSFAMQSQAALNTIEGHFSADTWLNDKILDHLTRNRSFVLSDCDPIWEAVGKVFLAMRSVTDGEQARLKQPNSLRLETGLSYDDIRSIIHKKTGQQITEDDISIAIDQFVDRGLTVPKVVNRNKKWLRVFYCGEDEDDQDTLQLKLALHNAYKDYLTDRTNKPLSVFDMQKLCVSLKALLPWLPLTIFPFRFGYVSATNILENVNHSWLTAGANAPCLEIIEEKPRILRPNKTFSSPVGLSWSLNHERDFFDAFDFTAKAFSELPDEALLLISSCRTHRHTFNAMAFEARSWCYGGQSFGSVLTATENILKGNSGKQEPLLNSLYWCIRYISEALKKKAVFYDDFSRQHGRLKGAFEQQGGGAKRWWRLIESKALLDSAMDPEIENRMKQLDPLLDQMKLLTIYVVHLLCSWTVLTFQDIKATFTRVGGDLSYGEFNWLTGSNALMAASRYNNAIQRKTLPGRSFFTQSLQDRGLEKDPRNDLSLLHSALTTTKTCFEQICCAIELYCPIYKTQNREFPFAPDYAKRLLDDGSLEVRHDNVYLLTVDIIKGTNSQQTNAMKDRIRHTFEFLRNKDLSFEDTGNDAFIACCEDPLVLWDATNVLKMEGHGMLIPGERFGGTRKGLYFGSIAVIEKENGQTLIRDVTFPNVLPPAFSLLTGIDCCVEEAHWNDRLIVEKRTLERCSERLKLIKDSLQLVEVESKHFRGPCFLVDLP